MATNGVSLNPVALILCEQNVVQAAAQFGGTADTFSQGAAHGVGSGTVFGSLPASRRLAGLTAQVNDAGSSQFGAAEKFLRGTENALEGVLQTFASTEGNNAVLAAEAIAGRIQHQEQAIP
jgi:hypothetical protein